MDLGPSWRPEDIQPPRDSTMKGKPGVEWGVEAGNFMVLRSLTVRSGQGKEGEGPRYILGSAVPI